MNVHGIDKAPLYSQSIGLSHTIFLSDLKKKIVSVFHTAVINLTEVLSQFTAKPLVFTACLLSLATSSAAETFFPTNNDVVYTEEYDIHNETTHAGLTDEGAFIGQGLETIIFAPNRMFDRICVSKNNANIWDCWKVSDNTTYLGHTDFSHDGTSYIIPPAIMFGMAAFAAFTYALVIPSISSEKPNDSSHSLPLTEAKQKRQNLHTCMLKTSRILSIFFGIASSAAAVALPIFSTEMVAKNPLDIMFKYRLPTFLNLNGTCAPSNDLCTFSSAPFGRELCYPDTNNIHQGFSTCSRVDIETEFPPLSDPATVTLLVAGISSGLFLTGLLVNYGSYRHRVLAFSDANVTRNRNEINHIASYDEFRQKFPSTKYLVEAGLISPHLAQKIAEVNQTLDHTRKSEIERSNFVARVFKKFSPQDFLNHGFALISHEQTPLLEKKHESSADVLLAEIKQHITTLESNNEAV